jgi:hypothetical protein
MVKEYFHDNSAGAGDTNENVDEGAPPPTPERVRRKNGDFDAEYENNDRKAGVVPI